MLPYSVITPGEKLPAQAQSIFKLEELDVVLEMHGRPEKHKSRYMWDAACAL